MTQTEQMDAHALARLALEVAPHVELLQRIGGHFDTVLRMAVVMRDWTEVDAALQAAGSAPEALRATFHRATFEHFSRKYGIPAETIGALAHERRKDGRAFAPVGVAPAPALPVAPVKEAVQAIKSVKPIDPEHVAVVERTHELLKLTPMRAKDIVAACAALGVRVGETQIAGLRGGSIVRYAREGRQNAGINSRLAKDLYAALELLMEPGRTEEPRLRRLGDALPLPASITNPTAPTQEKKDDVDPALLTTRYDRVQFVKQEAKKNNGVVKGGDIKQALCVPYGAALGIIKDIPGSRHIGNDLYRIPTK